MHPHSMAYVLFNAKKPLKHSFYRQTHFIGACMAKDSWHGVIFPAYHPVVMTECFTKTIPVDGLELTHSTSNARLPLKPLRNNRSVNKENIWVLSGSNFIR